MGTWNTKINGSDTFLDIYQHFFELYNSGKDPNDISHQIQKDYAEMFNDHDDRNNCFFALALAQWETNALDPNVFQKVKEIIDSGNDLEVWRSLGADDKTLGKRSAVLSTFLIQLTRTKGKPKRRIKLRHEFTYNELVSKTAPDGRKTFTVSESFDNGAYVHTGSFLSWGQGGCSILYFTGQGKYISAKWLDSQTLAVSHDKEIVFTKKEVTFYFCGDHGTVIYTPTDLYVVK